MNQVNKSPRYKLKAAYSGYQALDALDRSREVFIMGISSYGIYIKTSVPWVVFLSFERFRGPLTINLQEIPKSLRLIGGDEPLHIDQGLLKFPRINLTISATDAKIWRAPPTPIHCLSSSERRNHVIDIALDVLKQVDNLGYSAQLASLVKPLETETPFSETRQRGQVDLFQIQKYYLDRDFHNLVGSLDNLIGSGEGLTPGGDDVLIGLLLSLNRWKDVLWRNNSLTELNQFLIRSAYKSTTTISGNLIECAAAGQADERLIHALDWMMTGIAGYDEIVSQLLSWGNTSGLNAFIGMVVAIIA